MRKERGKEGGGGKEGKRKKKLQFGVLSTFYFIKKELFSTVTIHNNHYPIKRKNILKLKKKIEWT